MTYSIVARDERTGMLGVAVQSHFFGAGRLVCWAEAGVGAVATQAIPEVSYGPLGLDGLREGRPAKEVLDALLAGDPGRELRQVAVVGTDGGAAVHTGAACLGYAGHVAAGGVSAQANMAGSDRVWGAMVDAFEAADGDLADRLLAALDAGEAAGGDARGVQSAALVVVGPERVERAWEGVLVDLRVEDSLDPLGELRRVLGVNRACNAMLGALLGGPVLLGGEPTDDEREQALGALVEAQDALGANAEPTFWRAVVLARAGRVEEARSALEEAARGHAGWRGLFERVPPSGILTHDQVRAVTG